MQPEEQLPTSRLRISLAVGMKLETDPTVRAAIGPNRSPGRGGNAKRDLQIDRLLQHLQPAVCAGAARARRKLGSPRRTPYYSARCDGFRPVVLPRSDRGTPAREVFGEKGRL